MKTSIKMCGLSTREAVERASSLGAARAGFIFFPKSPRHVTVTLAAELAALARYVGLQTVAVTVNADAEYLEQILGGMKPDMLQLHGAETVEQVRVIKSRYGLPVIKAFAIRETADLDAVKPYIGVADLFLFDAKPPKGSELPGGNGVSFDWRLLGALDPGVNYMLSGGLTKDNVGAALELTGAAAVDVSSGIERAPGIKDLDMMDSFVQAIRTFEDNKHATAGSA